MKIPAKFLGKYFPRRIWLQIFFILVFLVVIPLFALGALLVNTSQKAVKTSVLRDHKELSIRATKEVNEYIEGPRQALYVTAALLGTLKSNQWQQETTLVELALRYPIFERISAVNLSGQEIVTSQLGTSFLDRSREEAFLKAEVGEQFVSEVMINDNYIPTLMLSTPIKQSGKINGVLLAEVNLRGLWDIIDSIKIGETGRALLIDHQGRLIAHPDKKLVLQNKTPLNPRIIGDVLMGNAGSLEELDEKGESHLVAYAPVEKMSWGLVILQSTKEAYAFSKIMKIQSWILILISICATIAISLLLARFMSRSSDQLIKATQSVARGDFDYRLRVARRDEVGRLFRSFNTMTGKLKEARHLEKLGTIGKAATAIAHELKNSLVLVNTYIRLLPERHHDKKFVDGFSKIVPRELDSWKSMLQNMINYSKVSHFPMTESVDIDSLIEDIAALARQRAQQTGIDFVVSKNGNLPIIYGNSDRLKQVFVNILNNAMESTPTGGSIIFSAELAQSSDLKPGSFLKIQIDDTGEGIPDQHINRIFDPFFTTKQDGLGLGLSVSKEIVDFHGGHIKAFNRMGGGASFSIILPVEIGRKKLVKSDLKPFPSS